MSARRRETWSIVFVVALVICFAAVLLWIAGGNVSLALAALAITCGPWLLLAWVWGCWMVRHDKRSWQCKACGYDLRGIAGDVCPECGHARVTTVTLIDRELSNDRGN